MLRTTRSAISSADSTMVAAAAAAAIPGSASAAKMGMRTYPESGAFLCSSCQKLSWSASVNTSRQNAASGWSWTSISAGTTIRVNGNRMSQPSKPDPVDA